MVEITRRRLVAPAAVGAAGLVGTVWLIVDQPVRYDQVLFLVAALVFVAVGVIVLARAGGNRVGWVLALIGLALTASGHAERLAERGWMAAGAISGTLWFSWFVLVGFLFLWFPTGRLPSPRWRVVEWLGYIGSLVTFSYLFAAEICLETNDDGACAVWTANPIGIAGVPNPEHGPLAGLNQGLLRFYIFGAIAAIIVRFVKSRGVERLQLKWLLLSAVALFTVALVQESVSMPVWLDESLFGLSVVALPVSIGVAILKFRLYDIERIISRSLGYGLVVAILVLFYVVLALWLPSQLIGEQPPIFVAATTLLAAAVFNPLRRSILRTVDRRFYRSRYDTEMVMTNFASHLREQVDMDRLANDRLAVVIRTMGPASAGVWMRKR